MKVPITDDAYLKESEVTRVENGTCKMYYKSTPVHPLLQPPPPYWKTLLLNFDEASFDPLQPAL